MWYHHMIWPSEVTGWRQISLKWIAYVSKPASRPSNSRLTSDQYLRYMEANLPPKARLPCDKNLIDQKTRTQYTRAQYNFSVATIHPTKKTTGPSIDISFLCRLITSI